MEYWPLIEKIIIAALGAAVTWVFKLRKDIDAAFFKIRELEMQHKNLEDKFKDK